MELPYVGDDLAMLVLLPKFKFATRYYLDSDALLPTLGMKDAFDQQRAEFSGINGLSISHVIHQVMIEVNEQGSEAAASTAVVIGMKSMPMRPIKFRADHPFLFLIVHKPTNTILFMGTVNDPTKE